jgi:hypothetical protein
LAEQVVVGVVVERRDRRTRPEPRVDMHRCGVGPVAGQRCPAELWLDSVSLPRAWKLLRSAEERDPSAKEWRTFPRRTFSAGICSKSAYCARYAHVPPPPPAASPAGPPDPPQPSSASTCLVM